jgi:hypothetical protein
MPSKEKVFGTGPEGIRNAAVDDSSFHAIAAP